MGKIEQELPAQIDLSDQRAVDSLFPKPHLDWEYETITARSMPWIARGAAEFLHGEKPDTVIAADRGGRMLAFATFYSWHKRYPDEPFPTRDGKLQIARLSKNISEDDFDKNLEAALTRAGVIGEAEQSETSNDELPKVTFMDDWVLDGGTFSLFKKGLRKYGIPRKNVSAVTMSCNMTDGPHYIHPDIRGVNTGSKWGDLDELIGVSYEYGPEPKVMKNKEPLKLRQDIIDHIDRYFDRFDAAVRAGEIAVPELVEMAG